METTRSTYADRNEPRRARLGATNLDQTPPAQVTVSSGFYMGSYPLANRTVADIREQLGESLDIDPEAAAIVDGQAVNESHVLTAGQTLRFIRRAGEKG